MAEEMNRVRDGLKQAVEAEMKSERLKTDLITNVSHDIKTPLTSIINYVDILKRENIQDEKIAGYIDILDRKSMRLKQLTEDLVEASKISSGNITLDMQEINLKQLIKQTNGEFEEKFSAKNLELVCSLPESEMIIKADGRRMFRVIENLYNNTAKYSMPHSRVYVTGELKGQKVIFSIKNMSEYALNFKAEELLERFVRGDVSRSTEGSGLGLEIARNLTVMQGGTFDLYVDGDLFKVTIAFDAI
jgi:K+-sensing histidine kinase KdpD